ncbi:MAG: methylated-DNA--[protein]-cysteine S-methyltransferase [Planctomycetes bacterium]|nr:methylated-DNA--[protein]-cysteine S-methyltransferase [Planctomycetota bacterium]
MEPVFVEVLDCAWGAPQFSFAANGFLTEISLRFSEPKGGHGERPGGAPSKRVLRSWLRDYERGGGAEFPGFWELPGKSEFRRAVYQVVAAIPVGETLSYGEVAIKAGSPGASRAVGVAMGENPLPLVVP